MLDSYKKMLVLLVVLLATSSQSHAISGLFSSPNTLGLGLGYSSAESGAFSVAAQYTINDIFDVGTAALFYSKHTPITLATNIYIIKPKKDAPIAVWLSPQYALSSQTESGIKLDVSAIAASAYFGYKVIAEKFEVLPYIGLSVANATASIKMDLLGKTYTLSTQSSSSILSGGILVSEISTAKSKLFGVASATIPSTGSSYVSLGLGYTF